MDKFTSLEQIEREAMQRLNRNARSYYTSGAMNMVSLQDSNAAFSEFYLKAAAEVDPDAFQGTQTTFLGQQLQTPIAIASTAFHRMAYHEGEVATAKAANNTLQTPVLLSSWATSTIEEVGQAAPDSMKLFQIYMLKDMEVNDDLWKRCRDNGYKAMCLTTDTSLLGKRDSDTRLRFNIPKHLDLVNLARYKSKGQQNQMSSQNQSALYEYVQKHKNNEVDWSIIPTIKKMSRLPVFTKGIMGYADAKNALDNGADGIFVSNHGARQLDTTPATIQVLPGIMQAMRDSGRKVPVIFDGGVRTGEDVLKALIFGADIVMIGRPVLYGLACDGQRGVERVLEILNAELREAMLATGCMNIEQVRGNLGLLQRGNDTLFTRQPKL